MSLSDNYQKQLKPCLGRILCLTSSFPGSEGDNAGIFVYHLAKDLHDMGWRVDVLTPHRPGLSTMEERDGVRVFRFRYLWPESLETMGHSGSTVVNLRKNPFNYTKIIPLVSFQGLNTFQKLLANKYDLIHSHWIIPQGLHGMLGSFVWGLPHIVTVHGGDIYSFNSIVLKWMKSLILKRAKAVTVNSLATKQQVEKMAPKLSWIADIPMGILFAPPQSETSQQLRQEYRIGDGPLLLFVGRVVEEKGVGDFIEALKLLQNDLPDVRALIVGDGQEKERFVRFAQEFGVNEKITFVGHVGPARVADYYAAADIFIGPSKKGVDGWTEGLGMTFIEAMYAKLPVIATKSGGIVDSVHHERTGLLVNENSPREIAKAVKRLLNDPQLVERLVEQGYRLATEKYSRQACAQKFSTLFKKVLG